MTEMMAIDAEIKAILNGDEEPCSHPWRHTVYGSDDPTRNGTTCVVCGQKV